ncbi:zinc-binding dehydrogenase [Streptomyces olindensis]|uniref:Zinc-binding dehydrogenase n=1 Tax=Streptomyces olindensis TaxID=358823 RepID=A0ABV2XRZ8_9ACTN
MTGSAGRAASISYDAGTPGLSSHPQPQHSPACGGRKEADGHGKRHTSGRQSTRLHPAVVERVYPLSAVQDAHRAVETGHARGKRVVDPTQ